MLSNPKHRGMSLKLMANMICVTNLYYMGLFNSAELSGNQLILG